MIVHKPDRKALTERLIALRRARTKPLDSTHTHLSWPDRLTLVAAVLVLLLFVVLVLAILVNVIGPH